jgi:hypothetical protein
MNAGATSEEEAGAYVGWGETESDVEGRTNYAWANYKWCDGTQSIMTKYVVVAAYAPDGVTDGLTTLTTDDDIATRYGGKTPTPDQLAELMNKEYCTWTLDTINDRKGARVTSVANGNSIFIPGAGFKSGTRTASDNSAGCLWSNTLYTGADKYYYNAYVIRFGISSKSISLESGDHNGSGYVPRYYGYTVRPVKTPTSGIENVTTSESATIVRVYNAAGTLLDQPRQGLNIVVYSDGTTKKVLK